MRKVLHTKLDHVTHCSTSLRHCARLSFYNCKNITMLIKNGCQFIQRKIGPRYFSTHSTCLSKSRKEPPSDKKKKVEYGALSKAQKAYLDRTIRVDQAGELGADFIYMGQYFVLAHKYPHLKSVLQHMWDQEIHHHNKFNDLQSKHRVRPSLFTPLWKLGSFGLGVGTAMLSKEAAMACTVAVETVIGGHYNLQLRVLMNQYDIPVYDKETGKPIPKDELPDIVPASSPEMTDLKKLISTFRDDELEHLDTAIEHDAEKAVPYRLLTEGIKLLCKGAIWTAERV